MRSFLRFSIPCLLALSGCRSRPQTPPAPPADTVRSSHPASVSAIPADTVDFATIRFLQLQRSEDSTSWFTQDDCRCTQETAVFGKGHALRFSRCGSVPPEGRYTVRRIRRDSATGITVFTTHADTLVFQRVRTSPSVYWIRRSNYYDVEGGLYFIDARDSAKFEHQDWDCEEYQG